MTKSTPKNTTTRKNYGITRPKRGGKKVLKDEIKIRVPIVKTKCELCVVEM